MLAVIVNTLAVFTCGMLGTGLSNRLAHKYQEAIMKFLPIAIIILGIDSALKGDIMIMIISIVGGVLVGEYLDLEGGLDKFAEFLKNRFIKDSESDFSTGFISGILLFCVGSMGILGSIDAGVKGDYSILFTKSVLDGLSALFLAASLGRGIAFASLAVLVYEGSICLLAGLLSPLFTDFVLANISGVGGLTILAIGLSMLDIVDFRIANALPALAFPVIISLIMSLF